MLSIDYLIAILGLKHKTVLYRVARRDMAY